MSELPPPFQVPGPEVRGDEISTDVSRWDSGMIIHRIEFRVDGVIEITASDRNDLTEKVAVTKLITIHPDVIPNGELADVLDTIEDWCDKSWEHLRGAR